MDGTHGVSPRQRAWHGKQREEQEKMEERRGEQIRSQLRTCLCCRCIRFERGRDAEQEREKEASEEHRIHDDVKVIYGERE